MRKLKTNITRSLLNELEICLTRLEQNPKDKETVKLAEQHIRNLRARKVNVTDYEKKLKGYES